MITTMLTAIIVLLVADIVIHLIMANSRKNTPKKEKEELPSNAMLRVEQSPKAEKLPKKRKFYLDKSPLNELFE